MRVSISEDENRMEDLGSEISLESALGMGREQERVSSVCI